MQTTSDEIPYNDMNLLLIDDRLAYHYYLATDKKINTLRPIAVDDKRRMDLAIFDAAYSYTTDRDQINSLTIVEFKRPMRNDTYSDENDRVWQVLKYVKAIREGKVKKDNGCDFGDMSHVSFYCYVIGDLTDLMRESAERSDLILTQHV